MSIPAYPTNAEIPLEEQGTWPAGVHRFESEAALALRAAEACGRPLLVRGAPGVGKSQTARAAAAFANRAFHSAVIDGRTEAQDLMWRFDAVRRLADAQARRAGESLPDEMHYVEPSALWWAYDPESAREQAAVRAPPLELHPPVVTGRAVLLIDEIDKADPELPNALLDVLGNRGFTLPFGGKKVTCSEETRPLVVITTNEERELPNAFLRRCLVLKLELPSTEAKLCDYLVALGMMHETFLLSRKSRAGRCWVMREAAQRLWAARKEAGSETYPPGTAEYLDLIGALANLWPDNEREQRDRLDDLARYAFDKSAH